jgi:hypothetical protein
MSQGDDRFGPNPYASNDGGQPKRGMSTGTKVLLILGGVFGVLAIACCGFLYYVYDRIANSFTSDPKQVAAIQQEIVDIRVPPGFAPQGGMDLGLGPMKVKVAVYVRNGREMLMLMQMPGVASDEEMRKQMEEAFEKQGQKQDVKVRSREVRKIKIDGQEYPFEFTQGVQGEDQHPVRQVIGVFPGKKGTAMLMYMCPEEDWDDDEVMEMLRSISK